MKRFYPTYNIILTVSLLLAFSLVSCIKDDVSDCESYLRLYFRYTPESQYESVRKGINPQNVSCINLYVFDENGKFIQEIVDKNPYMSEDYYIEIPEIATGNYQFIAWGGLDKEETYVITKNLVKGETTLSELELHLNSIEDGRVTNSLSHLFYASHKQHNTINVRLNDQRDTLDLIQDTYKINILVSEMESNNDTYQLTITDINGQYNFKNEITSSSSQTIEYISSFYKLGRSQIRTSITVLQLSENRRTVPTLQIINEATNKPLFNSDIRLIELLLALEEVAKVDIDLSVMHEFDIEFVIDETTELGVQIWINGWKLTDNEEQLYG